MQNIEQEAHACAICYMILVGMNMEQRVKELFPPGPFNKLLPVGLYQNIPQKATWQQWNAILEVAIEKLKGDGGFDAYRKALFNVMCKKSHQWRDMQRTVWNGQRKEWV